LTASRSGPVDCASEGAGDRKKVSRVITPRFGVDPAADGSGAGGRLALAAPLEPSGSSAMILRIDARISSMLGSALVSSLDIPYLLNAETAVSRHNTCTQ
jgi:hypothetical protein